MRALLVLAASIAIASVSMNLAAAAEEKAGLKTCSANSADKTQSCSVSCPEGKTATCTGGNTPDKGPSDVNCTCK
jgi:hypothetical protein